MWNALFSKASLVTTDSTPDSSYRDSTGSLRAMISPDEVMRPRNFPRLLVLDDDPTFGRLMQQVADKKGAPLTFCKSVEDLAHLPNWDYDVIIMDYDLGSVTGFELTAYLEKFTKVEVPVILVSHSKLRGSEHWPATIREFVHKGLGPFAILDAAFEAHEVSVIHSGMREKRPMN